MAAVVLAVSRGGIHFSQQIRQIVLRDNDDNAPPSLTPRMIEALELCAAYLDAPTSQLAGRMGIASSTMRNLMSSADLRLNVRSRAAAVNRARELGLIAPGRKHYDLVAEGSVERVR